MRIIHVREGRTVFDRSAWRQSAPAAPFSWRSFRRRLSVGTRRSRPLACRSAKAVQKVREAVGPRRWSKATFSAAETFLHRLCRVEASNRRGTGTTELNQCGKPMRRTSSA
jgi:hypothetical protein